MPVFSIIIPLFNKKAFIGEVLRRVLLQSFTNYEVIIIDDGSTDGSAEIVNSFTASNLTCIKTKNQGVSAARNTGIKAASGTLIAFLDADDYWDNNHLEELYKLHISFPGAGLLASRYKLKFSEAKIVKPCFKNLPENFRGIVPDFFKASLTYRIAWTSALAVDARVLKHVGLFNELLSNGEDNDLWIRIALKYDVALGNCYTAIYNYHIIDTLSKKKISERALPNFARFAEAEKTNASLKKFLDMYRLQYALHLKADGNPLWKGYYKKINRENISTIKTILLHLPGFLLRALQIIKKITSS